MWHVASKIRHCINGWRLKKKVPDIENIFTHLTVEEKYCLYSLARSRRKQENFVEVGSYLGASSLCIAAGFYKQSILYCVDTWENDAMSEGFRDTYEAFLCNIKNFSDKIVPLRGESTSLAATFDKPVGLLFLDGDHSYKGIKADIDAWWPKLRSGGIIAMHDIGWAEGVQQIAQEFVMPNSRNHGRLPNLFWATKVS